jgi:hypothetical protein
MPISSATPPSTCALLQSHVISFALVPLWGVANVRSMFRKVIVRLQRDIAPFSDLKRVSADGHVGDCFLGFAV